MKKMLKIVAALDSFKGSLSSQEAGDAVKAGLLRRIPDAEVTVFAVGDGGSECNSGVVADDHGAYLV